MLKGLLVGAGVFLAGLLLGAVLLAKPGAIGANPGGLFTNPVVFSDEITLDENNCAQRTSVVIPAISGINSAVGALANRVATSVTLSQAAVGDLAFASWNSSTGTLQALNLSLTANASTSAITVFFENNDATTSSANNIGTLRVCSIDI